MGRRSAPVALVAAVLCGMIVVWGANSAHSLARYAIPKATPPMTIIGEVLGRASPVSVENPELTRNRVTDMPGAVEWHQGDDPAGVPHVIGPAETVVVCAGHALVDSPESVHQGRNNGAVPLVTYLSTLFPTNAPRGTVVEAIRTP